MRQRVLIARVLGRTRPINSTQRSTAALDPKPTFVLPSRSACGGGGQTTVPSIFERRAADLVQVDWLFSQDRAGMTWQETS
jgi:hypothetical protein